MPYDYGFSLDRDVIKFAKNEIVFSLELLWPLGVYLVISCTSYPICDYCKPMWYTAINLDPLQKINLNAKVSMGIWNNPVILTYNENGLQLVCILW